MEHLICYDLSDDARRNRVVQTLLDFGERIQESVFVAFLGDEHKKKLLCRLEAIISPAEDAIHVFPLCESCAAKATAIGTGRLPKDEDFYIV